MRFCGHQQWIKSYQLKLSKHFISKNITEFLYFVTMLILCAFWTYQNEMLNLNNDPLLGGFYILQDQFLCVWEGVTHSSPVTRSNYAIYTVTPAGFPRALFPHPLPQGTEQPRASDQISGISYKTQSFIVSMPQPPGLVACTLSREKIPSL